MTTLESVLLSLEVQTLALQSAVGAAFVAGLALLLAWFLRRRSEPMRYGILFTGILGLLAVPVVVGAGRSCQDWLPWMAAPISEEVHRIPVEMLPELLNRAPADEPDVQPEPPAQVAAILGAGLLLLWALGTGIGLCRLLWALWKQSRAFVGPLWSADYWTAEVKAKLAGQLGLARFPDVHLCPAAPMPMVMGIWRPVIVLPDPLLSAWGQPQCEAVLLHEAAHIARRDHWAILVQRLAVVLFWWCPLVHRVGRRLNELRENICDDCALQGSCDHIAYVELLVESAERFLNLKALPVSLGLLDSARVGLEARVTRLLEKERSMMTKLSLSGKILGAGFLVLACLLTAAGTAFSGGQPPPQKRIQIKIVVDGKEINLDDARIWELIEAAQRKTAKADPRIPIFEAVPRVLPDKPAQRTNADKIAISPDGKMLIQKVDGKLIVLDHHTGKIIAQWEDGKADPRAMQDFNYFYLQTKPDPRIEELVRQAEAIKPGSGADIRRALQAVPARKTAPVTLPATEAGLKWIILAVEEDKLRQMNHAELKALLEKSIHIRTPETRDRWIVPPSVSPKPVEAATRPATPSTAVPLTGTSAPTPAASDIEALSRQLERINLELLEMRKRLEADKKRQGR